MTSPVEFEEETVMGHERRLRRFRERRSDGPKAVGSRAGVQMKLASLEASLLVRARYYVP